MSKCGHLIRRNHSSKSPATSTSLAQAPCPATPVSRRGISREGGKQQSQIQRPRRKRAHRPMPTARRSSRFQVSGSIRPQGTSEILIQREARFSVLHDAAWQIMVRSCSFAQIARFSFLSPWYSRRTTYAVDTSAALLQLELDGRWPVPCSCWGVGFQRSTSSALAAETQISARTNLTRETWEKVRFDESQEITYT